VLPSFANSGQLVGKVGKADKANPRKNAAAKNTVKTKCD